MTPEERIAQLEAVITEKDRAIAIMAEALRAANLRIQQEGEAARLLAERREAARLKKQRQRALRGYGVEDGMSRDSVPGVSPGQSRDITGTDPSPSLPPPSSSPSLPEPISPPPLSSPNPSSPPDLFGVAEAPPVSSAKKPGRRAKKPEPTDPRHAPLVRELCEGVGYPFRDGRDGRAVTDLLRLADQRESTRGEHAPAEVLRRARIGWAWKGFPSCRSLTELRDHWGHYERPQEASGTRGPAPPSDFENPRAGSPIPEHLRSRPEDVEAF